MFMVRGLGLGCIAYGYCHCPLLLLRHCYGDGIGYGSCYVCDFGYGINLAETIRLPLSDISRFTIRRIHMNTNMKMIYRHFKARQRQLQRNDKGKAMHGSAMGSAMETNAGKAKQGMIT